MFVSDLFTGSISDRELVVLSQVLNYIEKEDDIVADRGFTISDLLEVKKVTFNMPPFKNGKAQLSKQETVSGRQIASLQIHVERAIGRMKHFRILNSVVPLKCSRSLSMTFRVCAYLSNVNGSLIARPPTITSKYKTKPESSLFVNHSLSNMPSSGDAISPGQLSVKSSSVASNDLSDDCSENLESSPKMTSFTNCFPWGFKSQDGRIIFSNTCTIDNMLNIFFYLLLMQPLMLDEFRRMCSSFAIALTTAYDYFTQGQ